jgi:HlyD family secretion protein
LWIVVALLVAGGVFMLLRARGPLVRTVNPVRKDLEQHLVASGRVWVPTRMQVSAQIPGLVTAVAVREGDTVHAGDLLVQLNDTEARAAVAQADAAARQANARVDQLRRVGAIVATGDLSQAQTNADRARAELQRVSTLASSGAIAPVEVDNARRAVQLAAAQLSAAQARQIASTPSGADSRIALTALQQAMAALDAANARLSQTRIVAQQDATVLSRSVEPGDVVQPSRQLLMLSARADAPTLAFQSDERNLAAIHRGALALASTDAYPDQTFEARVSYIAPAVDPERGSVEVRLSVDHPPPFLLPDMTVSVDLTVAKKSQVLTLPSEAIHASTSTEPWVFVAQDHHVVRKTIQLGIRGEGSMEIVSGLSATAEVILPDAVALVAGQRVRSQRQEVR